MDIPGHWQKKVQNFFLLTVHNLHFEPKTWEAPLWGGTIPVIWRHRTLQDYVKTFVKNGLVIVDLNEPTPTKEQIKISVPIAWRLTLFLNFKILIS